MKIFIVLLFMLLALTLTTVAQTFDFSGQIRPRAEYRHGYKTLLGDGETPGFNISQRTRVNMDYASRLFKVVISLQDVRVWGDVVSSNKSDLNKMMVHEAWGELFLTRKLSVKAGRQSISYDDERLFGVADWSQQSRSHEALVVKYEPSETTRIHAGFAYNQSADKDTGNFYSLVNYKALQYIWVHNQIKNMAVSFLFVNNGMPYNLTENNRTIQKIKYTQTFGPYLTYKKGDIKIDLAGYFQAGKNNLNIAKSAWYSGGDLVYALGRFAYGAAFQYFSGNNQVNPSTTDHEFSTLYGTAHKFNGWMDYFYSSSSHQSVGLLDLYVPVTYKKDKLTSEFQLHYYQATASVKDISNPAAAMSPALGIETGLMISYTFSPEMKISGGYSQMFGTETLQAIKGGDRALSQNWSWLMLNFTPTFFKSEK
ncbi:MAG: alginate export family protein [Lentimicrobiaceae bacterium]